MFVLCVDEYECVSLPLSLSTFIPIEIPLRLLVIMWLVNVKEFHILRHSIYLFMHLTNATLMYRQTEIEVANESRCNMEQTNHRQIDTHHFKIG